MNSTTTNTKSTAELKNQVIRDLQKVKEDFEEIKRRMTPGQIIDDALFFNREGATINDSFNLLKNNPVGTSFLTLGTLLLMENKNHMTYEGVARSQVVGVRTKVTDVVNKGKGAIQQVKGMMHSESSTSISGDISSGSSYDLNSPGESFSDNISAAGERISNSVLHQKDEMVDGVRSAVGSVKGSVSRGVDEVKSGLHSASNIIKEKAHGAIETAKSLDPLTYLALGAGLGTITGAALPISNAEANLLSGEVDVKLNEFKADLEKALNDSVNILKNEFIGGMTELNLHIF